jgi:hypothetical protein
MTDDVDNDPRDDRQPGKEKASAPQSEPWSYPPGIADAKTPLDCALAYADAGFRVFPVDGNKKPHIKGWSAQSRRSTAPMLAAWWSQWPRADVGWVIPTDIAVVDPPASRDLNNETTFCRRPSTRAMIGHVQSLGASAGDPDHEVGQYRHPPRDRAS